LIALPFRSLPEISETCSVVSVFAQWEKKRQPKPLQAPNPYVNGSSVDIGVERTPGVAYVTRTFITTTTKDDVPYIQNPHVKQDRDEKK
jgi:hypothetical protein